MTSGFFSGDYLRGLTVRVLFFLSLALLPIGLIALSQTQQISEQNRLSAELSILAVTEQAAAAQAHILQGAYGATRALAPIVNQIRDDASACREFLSAYREANPDYLLVGFIPTDGVMVCSSSRQIYDFGESEAFASALADPQLRVQRVELGSVTQQLVIVISRPVFSQETLVGFIAISISVDAFSKAEEPELPIAPLALATLNREGEVLMMERGMGVSAKELPVDVSLPLFTEDKEPRVFEARNQDGEPRIYAIRPMVSDVVFALSVWPPDSPFFSPSFLTRLTALVPLAMWLASLIVAFWALNRLAIRHIGKLERQMRRFALNRDLPRNSLGPSVPTELAQIEATFISMGESILRDEATLEDSLREKNILLKEVHHRVKNNLQLISSIMNMQIRQAGSNDVKRVLERLQERVLGLATVHKNLYQNDNLVRVNAETLLREVVNQLLSVGLAPGSNVRVVQEYASISLEADDAAPLTLLVSEALTNALKHVRQDTGTEGELLIQLEQSAPNEAQLVIRNSKGHTPTEPGTGLGFKLINAFARQLNGNFVIDDSEDAYELRITFPVSPEDKPTFDY